MGIEQDRQAKLVQTETRQIKRQLKYLTLREYKVFALVFAGMFNKQIAFDLEGASGVSDKVIFQRENTTP